MHAAVGSHPSACPPAQASQVCQVLSRQLSLLVLSWQHKGRHRGCQRLQHWAQLRLRLLLAVRSTLGASPAACTAPACRCCWRSALGGQLQAVADTMQVEQRRGPPGCWGRACGSSWRGRQADSHPPCAVCRQTCGGSRGQHALIDTSVSHQAPCLCKLQQPLLLRRQRAPCSGWPLAVAEAGRQPLRRLQSKGTRNVIAR